MAGDLAMFKVGDIIVIKWPRSAPALQRILSPCVSIEVRGRTMKAMSNAGKIIHIPNTERAILIDEA